MHGRSFFNLVWLILNDIIVGIAVGAFLYENSGFLSGQSVKFSEASEKRHPCQHAHDQLDFIELSYRPRAMDDPMARLMAGRA